MFVHDDERRADSSGSGSCRSFLDQDDNEIFHLSPQFQRESIQLLNGLCVDVSMPSQAYSERIVKKGHKNKEVRQPESPNLLLSLVELNGIEPSAS